MNTADNVDRISESARDATPLNRGTSAADWWARLGVCAIVFALWVLRLTGPIDLRYDAGVYFVLGTSLAEGHGYRLENEPGSPVAIQYPPGLPLLVAAHERVLGTSDPAIVGRWLRLSYAVMYLAFGFATLALARKYMGVRWAFLATALCLLEVHCYFLSDVLFTEIPFGLTAVLLALWLLRPSEGKSAVLAEAGGFVLATAGFALRTAGVALLLAWICEALFRRRYRLAGLRLVLAAVPVLLWQGHVARVQKSDAYQHPAYTYQRAPYQYYNVSYAENLSLIDPFQPELGRVNAKIVLGRVVANLKAMPVSIGEAVSEPLRSWEWTANTAAKRLRVGGAFVRGLVMVPLTILSVRAVAGLVLLARRQAWFLTVFSVGTVALVCTTPWPEQFARYLTPITPFLTIATVVAAIAVVAWAKKRQSRGPRRLALWSLAAFAFLIGFIQVIAAARIFRPLVRNRSMTFAPVQRLWREPRWLFYDGSWDELRRATDWIGRNSAPDAVVATSCPHLVYLQIKRKTVLPPMEPDPTVARKLLEQVPVSYVMIDQLPFLDIPRRYALPAIQSSPNWRLVQTVGRIQIYGRVPEAK
jgi:hypothetical protein